LNNFLKILSLFLCLTLLTTTGFSQEDSNDVQPVQDTARPIRIDSLTQLASPFSNNRVIDSLLLHHSPRKAALRSAILPGWGQIYNRKYWKLPIIYGALGVTGAVFIYNLNSYRELRFAYKARILAQPTPIAGGIGMDSSLFFQIKDSLLRRIDINALRSYRNEFRRNIDYTALVFILLWGLNIVDATVDAHLKTFDVSPDLSFRVKFGRSQMANTHGLSLVLAFK
jgi:hypothetical protein